MDPAADLPVFAVGDGARLDTAEGLVRIYNWILERELEVLVIDTLRRTHRLRENEADDMAKIEAAIKGLQRRVREELGRSLTVIVIHHSPKPRADSSNAGETMARGSSDIFAGVDVALYLRKGRERGQVVVEQAKQRWDEPLRPYLIEVQGSDDELRLAYRGSVEDTAGQQQRGEELVLAVLREGSGPRSKAELVNRGKAAKITQRTVERALKALDERGELVTGKSGRERTYDLTDAGILR